MDNTPIYLLGYQQPGRPESYFLVGSDGRQIVPGARALLPELLQEVMPKGITPSDISDVVPKEVFLKAKENNLPSQHVTTLRPGTLERSLG